MKSIQAREDNIKVGDLVYHRYLYDDERNPRFAIVTESDDGYGDVGVTFQQYPDLTYYFEICNLMIVLEE
jgi:hypothetical protein